MKPETRFRVLESAAMIQHVKPSADSLWELATRLIEKRTKPGDSIKSILRDLGQLYRGLKGMAPKSISEPPQEIVSKWLRGANLEFSVRPAALKAALRGLGRDSFPYPEVLGKRRSQAVLTCCS
jgi:hypothetical protein